MGFLVLKRFPLKQLSLCHFSSSASSRSSAKPAQSSLLISGKRAENTFVVVTPHLDFDQRFEQFSELHENIKKRKINLNLEEMKKSWEFYKDWNEKKLQLQENLNQAGKRLNELFKEKNNDENVTELKRLENYRNLLKEELLNVRNNVWSLEDNVISELLMLPNVLHPKAPGKEELLQSNLNLENPNNGFDHLDNGVKLNCLEYYNNYTYFLKNEAALFELAVSEMFTNRFCKEDFVRFSNPDFTRNVLAEGVGVAPTDFTNLFLLENTESNNDNLHLCGGASLFPFCGYHAKHSVPKQSLPVKYVAAGRCYNPITSSRPGLYSVHQSSAVHIFLATHGEEELYNEFQSCIQILHNIFSDIGVNFKIVSQPPECFRTCDSLRASVQLFSPQLKEFVEVANIGLVGDFISKRLRMCYSDKGSEPFLQVLSGTVVNAHSLLALCLERSENSLFIPNSVKEFIIS